MKKAGEKNDLKDVKKDDAEQSQKFVETAKQYDTPYNEASFDRALSKVSQSKKPPGN